MELRRLRGLGPTPPPPQISHPSRLPDVCVGVLFSCFGLPGAIEQEPVAPLLSRVATQTNAVPFDSLAAGRPPQTPNPKP